MIVRPRTNIFQLFFVVHGSVVPRILPHIVGFALYSGLVVALIKTWAIDMSGFTLAPFGLIGVTLSIYLSFRNGAAYDRWWEARKLWGQLVYDIRNLARATGALIPDISEARPLLMGALAFCHLLRGQLRGSDTLDEARMFSEAVADDAAKHSNRPDAAVRHLGARVAALYRGGSIDGMGLRILDERLGSLTALQAGCERIVGTPLPFAYTLLVQRTAYLYCLMLPLGLVSTAGWATPLLTSFVAYTFFGLDALSEEMEDPFGMEANDLALDGLCRVCEISVLEALGELAPAILPARNFSYT